VNKPTTSSQQNEKAGGTAPACCDTVLLSTCCGDDVKPSCCGPVAAPVACGCRGDSGPTPQSGRGKTSQHQMLE
jgi:hypothetical protein